MKILEGLGIEILFINHQVSANHQIANTLKEKQVQWGFESISGVDKFVHDCQHLRDAHVRKADTKHQKGCQLHLAFLVAASLVRKFVKFVKI